MKKEYIAPSVVIVNYSDDVMDSVIIGSQGMVPEDTEGKGSVSFDETDEEQPWAHDCNPWED